MVGYLFIFFRNYVREVGRNGVDLGDGCTKYFVQSTKYGLSVRLKVAVVRSLWLRDAELGVCNALIVQGKKYKVPSMRSEVKKK